MTTRFAVDIIKPLNTEAYRSGHNEAVLKTVWVKAHGGSNPSASANARHGNSRAFFTLRQREYEITYRYTSFRSPSLHSGRIPASAKVRLARKSQTKGHHKTVSFLFAPYCFAAQQATAEGRRNNVSLHFVSLPLVALGTNPCLRQRKARQQPCLFHASAEGRRNNVTGLLHNPYSVATELLLTNPCLRQAVPN